MPMTLARASTSVVIGSAHGLLGDTIGGVEAFGALAVGGYLELFAPGAFPGVDEALSDAGAALLARDVVPTSVWIGLVGLTAIGGLVLFELIEELGGHPI